MHSAGGKEIKGCHEQLLANTSFKKLDEVDVL